MRLSPMLVGWHWDGSRRVRPSDRCRGLARKDQRQGGAPAAQRGRTTLTLIFPGERMPGASRTARSALRARGHRDGVSARTRPAAGAGLAAGGGAAPGGLPPVGRGFPAAPGSASCPADPAQLPGVLPRRYHATLRGDIACFTAWSWPWPAPAGAPPGAPLKP
jgi:hypothetical protein